jgi:hypothetical protein
VCMVFEGNIWMLARLADLPDGKDAKESKQRRERARESFPTHRILFIFRHTHKKNPA